MRTRVQKWGNSLALRIPKSFAAEVGLAENAAVDLSVKEGRLVVEVEAEELLRIEDLLDGITDQNLYEVQSIPDGTGGWEGSVVRAER